MHSDEPGFGYDDIDNGDIECLPCPSCGEMVYEETEKCPYCGDWIMPLAVHTRPARWIRWVGGGLVVLMLLGLLGGLIRGLL